jgi:hypothetical protein
MKINHKIAAGYRSLPQRNQNISLIAPVVAAFWADSNAD